MSTKYSSVHLWLPNTFNFKGGIQVYLQDFLSVLSIGFPNQEFSVYIKLDTSVPTVGQSFSSNFSFFLNGNTPKIFRTLSFAKDIFIGAISEHPKLIICSHINFSPIALLLNRLFNIPYWILAYGVDVWDIENPLKIQAMQAADKIVSISDYTRNRLVKEQNLFLDKIPLLPVTFDASRFSITDKPEKLLFRYKLNASQPIILTVARLDISERYKGYDQILLSLPIIRQMLPDIHYIIVGKGNDQPRIQKLIDQLELHDCVTLTGFISDEELCDHYNLCDVFAMPSKGEGFGIVYLEALACGKPTLGGNQDGAIDALCQGKLGALVNPDDINEIAQTLIEMLQGTYPNPLIYQPEALRQQVIETYGFERFKQTLLEYLQDQLHE